MDWSNLDGQTSLFDFIPNVEKPSITRGAGIIYTMKIV